MRFCKCPRYVKETRGRLKVNLGGGYSLFSGQIGVEIGPPEVQRLANTHLLSLDIVQHYCCQQVKEARKLARRTRDEDEKTTYTQRANEMRKKRDEVFDTLLGLTQKFAESVIEQLPSEGNSSEPYPEKITSDLTNSFREHQKKVLEYGKGISDENVTAALKKSHLAYEEARPFLGKVELKDLKQLVVFKTQNKRTVLKITDRGLECHLFDAHEEKVGGLQWVISKNDINNIEYRVIPGLKPTTGVFSIGSHHNCPYSKILFPEPERLEFFLTKILKDINA